MCLNKRRVKCRLRLGGALLGTGLCVAANVAGAYPATAPLWGPSGLGIIPTTETVEEGIIEAGLGYETVNPAGAKVRFLPVISGTYGFERGEVGAGYLRERVSGGGVALNSDYFIVHGKYRLLEQPDGAQIVAGAHYLKFDSNVGGGVTSVYLSGSYPFLQQKLRGHAGLMYQRTSSGGFANSEVRPMIGAEWRATEKCALSRIGCRKRAFRQRSQHCSALRTAAQLERANWRRTVSRRRHQTFREWNLSFRCAPQNENRCEVSTDQCGQIGGVDMKKLNFRWLFVVAVFGALSVFAPQARAGGSGCSTIVINTNDSGAGSLREAINCTNSTLGVETITFDIPGAGVRTHYACHVVADHHRYRHD